VLSQLSYSPTRGAIVQEIIINEIFDVTFRQRNENLTLNLIAWIVPLWFCNKIQVPKGGCLLKPNVELALNILRRVLGSKSYHNFI